MKWSRLAIVAFFPILALSAGASTQEGLEAAARNGAVAFVLVSEPGTQGLDPARGVIAEAMKQAQPSVLVELNRADPDNAPLVARFRLAGAPLPLILVVSNGVAAGGLPAARASADALARMVPSPRKTEVLAALQAGKAVFIVLDRDGMPEHARVLANCGAAAEQLQGKAATVQVDLDDKAEAGHLAQLRVDPAATEPVIVAVNAQGQITGAFKAATPVADLVAAATKKAGGCCPSTVTGPAASCGPGQK